MGLARAHYSVQVCGESNSDRWDNLKRGGLAKNRKLAGWGGLVRSRFQLGSSWTSGAGRGAKGTTSRQLWERDPIIKSSAHPRSYYGKKGASTSRERRQWRQKRVMMTGT